MYASHGAVDDRSEPLPRKEQIARALLMKGSVFVHLDGRAEGVSLPNWLRQEAQVVLQLGLDLPIPIPDLRVDESGFFGTLAFQQDAHACQAGWDAVYALVGEDGRGMVWPDSLPKELSRELSRPPTAIDAAPVTRLVRHRQAATAKSAPAPAASSAQAKPSYLRLVK